MKKNILKLNQLSKAELEARQMNALKGGVACVCVGCLCSGGISVMDATDSGHINQVTASSSATMPKRQI